MMDEERSLRNTRSCAVSLQKLYCISFALSEEEKEEN